MFFGLDVLRDLCHPEIQNLGVAALGHKNIGRLDVAVDDALCVGSVQSIGDLDAQIEHRLDFQRLATDPVPERLALQKFHGDEGSPLGLVNLVNGADVRMIQCRSGLGFALKTAECLRAFGYIVGQELESHKATELHILGLVYDTHRAGAELLDDVIVRDGLSNHWRESYFCETGESIESLRVGATSGVC